MEKEDYLIDGETILYSVEEDKEYLYLTDKRVLYMTKTGFFSQNSKFKDIMFHHISSVELGTISYISLLILGSLIVGIGLAFRIRNDFQTITIPLLIVGVIFIVIYFFYREAGIIFITENEKIPIRFGGADAENYVKYISKIIRKFDK